MSLAQDRVGGVGQMHDRWMDVVAGLPPSTIWAVDAELTTTSESGRRIESRGILGFDEERLRFTDWRGSILFDVSLRTVSASLTKGDLRIAAGDRVFVLDDICDLRERLEDAPEFAASPSDTAFLPVLQAVHAAR